MLTTFERAVGRSAHTPGPWFFYPDASHEICRDDRSAENVTPVVCFVNTEGTSEAQALADARLIAAAPEMLLEIAKQIDWLRHLRDEVVGRVRPSLVMGIDQSIKYLIHVHEKATGSR